MVSDPHRRYTLTTFAYDQLRSDIVSGRIGPQAPLIEAEIAQRLDMSKTPVREALLRLAREGLVEVNDFRGARVRSFSPKDSLEIFQLRGALEPMAIRLGFDAIGQAEFDHVEQLLVQASEAEKRGDWAELSLLNRKFHAGLRATCPNERVMLILDQLSDAVQLISLRGWAHRPTHSIEYQQHRDIFTLLFVERDLEAGCALLTEHIHEFIETHNSDTHGS